MAFHVTVPGAHFRPMPQDPPVVPIIAYLEGGWTSLSYRLAEEIKRQLVHLYKNAKGYGLLRLRITRLLKQGR